MKNMYTSILLFTALFLNINNSFAQLQSFRLGAINFHYSDTLGGTHNVLYFDIVLQHTNPEVSGPFNYAAGQYFFNFNPLIANGGALTYRIVNSDLPAFLRPVNPSISGNLLRLASNVPTPPGHLVNTSYPGSKLVRMSLRTTSSSFANVPLNLTWSNPGTLYPVLIAAFSDIFAIDVTGNGNFYIDSLNNYINVNLLHPSYNSSGNLSTENFIWNKVKNAEKYTLQVSEDSIFSALTVNDSLITDTSKTIANLHLGSKYYWRLKIRDSSGVSYFSFANKFFTKQFLVSPLNNSTGHIQTVNFIWNKLSDNVTKYILQISDDSLMTGLIHSDTLINDTNKTIIGLHYNSKYFWRVKAFYSGGSFDVSEVRNFKTRIVSITQNSPSNNSFNNPVTVNFSWLPPVPLVSSKYFLKIASDSLLSDIIYFDSLSVITNKTVSGFDLGTKYFWTISVKDSFNNFVSSEIWNFKTGSLEVYLYSPGNNSTNINFSPLMIWRKAVIDVSKYKLIVSGDSLQNDIVFLDSMIIDTFKQIIGLEFEKKYYWSVTAYDTIGNVKTSEIWNYKTSTFLISPPNNITVINPVLFIWYRLPSAVSYRLQVSSDHSFENIIFTDSSITDSSKIVSLSQSLTSFFWRISAKNSSAYFRTSEVWRFDLDFPIPVEILNFTSEVSENNISLNWSTGYEISNSGFDIERSNVKSQMSNEWTKIGNVTGNGTTSIGHSYSFTDRNVSTGSYSYRLKQTDFNGNFEYFNLSNEVVVGIPAKFELSQNYPNPFNPSTNLEFGIPELGFVSLKIYDASGKKVATLVNEIKTAGYYSVNFNGSNLSSGVYFYILSAGSFNLSKKMFLVK